MITRKNAKKVLQSLDVKQIETAMTDDCDYVTVRTGGYGQASIESDIVPSYTAINNGNLSCLLIEPFRN